MPTPQNPNTGTGAVTVTWVARSTVDHRVGSRDLNVVPSKRFGQKVLGASDPIVESAIVGRRKSRPFGSGRDEHVAHVQGDGKLNHPHGDRDHKNRHQEELDNNVAVVLPALSRR